jgi:hypothetical protein
MKIFMNQKIVAAALADNSKVVHESFFDSKLCIELILCDACAVILVARSSSGARDSLRLGVGGRVDTSFSIEW